MLYTFAAPELDGRRAERSARAAHWAIVLREAARRTAAEGNPVGPHAPYGTYATAQCSVCGGNAQSWCDDCQAAGRTYKSVYGNTMDGSAVCNRCERAGECGVCWRHLR